MDGKSAVNAHDERTLASAQAVRLRAPEGGPVRGTKMGLDIISVVP